MGEMGGLPLRDSRDAHAHPHLRREQWDAADGALLELAGTALTCALTVGTGFEHAPLSCGWSLNSRVG